MKRYYKWICLLVNIVIVIALVITLSSYIGNTIKKDKKQSEDTLLQYTTNVTSIADIYFNNHYVSLVKSKGYLESIDVTKEDALDYLVKTNSDSNITYQIIDCETFTGYYLAGDNQLSYTYDKNAYEYIVSLCEKASSNEIDDTVLNATTSFTNPMNGSNSIAFYTTIDSRVEGEFKKCLLFAIHPTSNLLRSLPLVPFNSAEGAIIDANGSYVVYTSSFKSQQVYEYFRIYNNLEYSQVDTIKQSVNNSESGQLYLKDARGQKRLFSYKAIPGTDNWVYFSSVLEADLDTKPVDYVFIIIFVGFFLVLAAIDLTIFLGMNNNLKKSVVALSNSMDDVKKANSAKSEFLSKMSHEIRTPLNVIIGYTVIANSNIGNDQKIMDCLKKSEVAAKHLLSIINDVLDMSSIESGKIKIEKEDFDFKGLINGITVMFYTLAKNKDVDYETIFETNVEEWLVGDQMRLNQILINLLNNAVKFTSPGGSVTLNIRQDIYGNDVVLHFKVTDTGIGMSEETLKRIWKPFEQANSNISKNFGGTGLGLSIVRSLIDLMNGEIKVESEIGVGSTFMVTLKLRKSNHAISAPSQDFSFVNALVIDDDRSTCEYVKLLMDRFNVRCSVATSGHMGLTMFDDAELKNDPYNLCIVDWKMPNMDGIEVVRKIRCERDESVPVIVLTAYDYSEAEKEVGDLKVNGFISKPLFQSSLFDLLVNLFGYSEKKMAIEEKSINFAGKSLLLVEDNEMNMEIAKEILGVAGFKIDTAWNGREAVDKFVLSEPGTYDLILMDIQMPVLDGYKATREIRYSDHPDAKGIIIIAMTANAFEQDVRNSLEAGMNAHISKPIDVYDLLKTLKREMKM